MWLISIIKTLELLQLDCTLYIVQKMYFLENFWNFPELCNLTFGSSTNVDLLIAYRWILLCALSNPPPTDDQLHWQTPALLLMSDSVLTFLLSNIKSRLESRTTFCFHSPPAHRGRPLHRNYWTLSASRKTSPYSRPLSALRTVEMFAGSTSGAALTGCNRYNVILTKVWWRSDPSFYKVSVYLHAVNQLCRKEQVQAHFFSKFVRTYCERL